MVGQPTVEADRQNGVLVPLVIAAAQPETVACDPEANARAHAEAIGRAGARVVVFPELSLTGYHLDAPLVAPDDAVLRPIVDACRRAGALALLGAPTAGPPGVEHLSVLAVDRGGARAVYHKWFLGGDEAGRFACGDGPAVVEVDGWRLGLAICRDTGVAEHAEATAAAGIDVYVAGVCEHGHDHPIVAERATRTATAHGVWVVVASFAGSTGEGYDPAAGRSGIWSPGGLVVARAGPDPGELATAALSPPGG